MGFWRDKNGSAAVMTAIALPVVAAAAGAALDYSRLRSTAELLQDSADSAALSGAMAAASGAADADVGIVAQRWFNSNLGHLSPMADQPALTTTVLSRSPALVKTEASASVMLLIASLLGQRNVNITRSATARAGQSQPVCLLVLSPNAASAWSMGGSSDLEAPGCAAHVNSSSSTALSSSGAASASTGGVYVAGPQRTAKGFSPSPVFDQPALPDPIASRISWPAPTSCDYTNVSVSHSTQTLNPGVYCGGLSVSTHGVAQLNPGVYVIRDGGVSVQSGGSIVGPSETSIVMVGPTSTFSVTGNGSIQVKSPSSGPWAGIAIAQKPQPTELTSSMSGGGETSIDGVVYLPTQLLSLTGGGSLTASSSRRIFVANRVQMSGNGSIYLKGDPTLLSEAGVSVALVE